MPRFVYIGEKRREISFPLGGIGSGCIGLDGTGRLRDWEIFNRPSKGSINGYSHFGIKAEKNGQLVDARVMNADLLGPYTGAVIPGAMYSGYGFGPSRYLLSGIPHFRNSEFVGEFPSAKVNFIDESFPGKVALCAFNPFIPLDEDNSSLPSAFFTIEVENTTEDTLDYTVALSLNNPAKEKHFNHLIENEQIVGITLCSDNQNTCDPEFGSLGMAVSQQDGISYQQYWYRGGWYDNLGIYWQDFTAPGPFKNRIYPCDAAQGNIKEDIATLAVRVSVAPCKKRKLRFIMSWHYPNCINYWSKPTCNCEGGCASKQPEVWKNYYATKFADAMEVAAYCLSNWDDLEERTERFQNALYGTTIPDVALEALTANLAVLKSPTCLRLEDGSFYGFEGCHCTSGCCEGSCTHVWNYAFALPFLFPKMERSMRELDYTYNLREDGGMPFRIQLPLGSKKSAFRPCVDGQMGGVIKTYREWKICGDNEWLKKWWPSVKKSLEFAWSPTNADLWDPNKTGVITGRQHHTLDMELFGPSSWLNGFYLAALKAGAEMAHAVGEIESADEYMDLFVKGKSYTDDALFNGEYYHQIVDIRDKSILKPYAAGETLMGGTTVDTYWNDEAGQLKYQIGEGCGIDQVLAQWMSGLCGLGDILDAGQVKSSLKSIYKYNYKSSFRNHFNPCRIYGLNDESGAVICEWPKGKEKPIVPVPYAEETMHGFEYQAASHMIGRGLLEEGLKIVSSIRSRYDGKKRNPWNEFECGSNYARSMASYALLVIYSGFVYDMTRKRMGINPIEKTGKRSYFWSLEGAWGQFVLDDDKISMHVLCGKIQLKEWVVPNADAIAMVKISERNVAYTLSGDAVVFHDSVTIAEGEALVGHWAQ